MGIAEYVRVARLLVAWQGGAREELAQVLAALLGKSERQQRDIRVLFHQHYSEPQAAPSTLNTQHRWLLKRKQRLLLMFVLALIFIPSLSLIVPRHPPMKDIEPRHDMGATLDTRTEVPPDQTQPPTIPPAERRVIWPHATLATILWLLIFVTLYRQRVLSNRQRRLQNYWRQRREKLAGPSHFEPPLTGLRSPFASEDLDDFATLLGRLGGLQGELDIDRTIDASVRRAGLIELVMRPAKMGRTLLVLQDCSVAMRPWTRKVEALMAGLKQRGIRFERYYLDGEGNASLTPDGSLVRLDRMAIRHAELPLLVLSDGSSAHTLHGKLRPWTAMLRRWQRRSWLHPVSNPLRWHPALENLFTHVWPMTLTGFRGAATDLRDRVDHRVPVPLEKIRPRVVMNARDAREVQRLLASQAVLSAVPLAQAELILQRFFPEMTDEVLLHLIASNGEYSGQWLIFSPEEQARLRRELQDVQRQGEHVESSINEFLDRLLTDAEPRKGSLAHLRWRLRRALHKIRVRDEAQKSAQAGWTEILELSRAELSEEVDSALRSLRSTSPGGTVAGGALSLEAMGLAPIDNAAADLRDGIERLWRSPSGWLIAEPGPTVSADAADSSSSHVVPPTRSLPWPGAREFVLAMMGAALAFIAVFLIRPIQQKVPHEIDAFKLESKIFPNRFELVATATQNRWQLQAHWLYEDQVLMPWPTYTSEIPNTTLRWALNGPRKQGHWYQIRIPLPGGNLALSNAVLIPPQLELPPLPPPVNPTGSPAGTGQERPPLPVKQGQLLVKFVGQPSQRSIQEVYTLHAVSDGMPYVGFGDGVLKLPPGEYKLSANIQTKKIKDEKITILPGQRTVKTITIHEEFGYLRLFVDDSQLRNKGALPEGFSRSSPKIIVNNKSYELGGQLIQLPPGFIKIKVNNIYCSYQESLKVDPGEQIDVVVVLQPKKIGYLTLGWKYEMNTNDLIEIPVHKKIDNLLIASSPYSARFVVANDESNQYDWVLYNQKLGISADVLFNFASGDNVTKTVEFRYGNGTPYIPANMRPPANPSPAQAAPAPSRSLRDRGSECPGPTSPKDFGPFTVGTRVILGKHERNLSHGDDWSPMMEQYLGKEATITRLLKDLGCASVRVDIDKGGFVWRINHLKLAPKKAN